MIKYDSKLTKAEALIIVSVVVSAVIVYFLDAFSLFFWNEDTTIVSNEFLNKLVLSLLNLGSFISLAFLMIFIVAILVRWGLLLIKWMFQANWK